MSALLWKCLQCINKSRWTTYYIHTQTLQSFLINSAANDYRYSKHNTIIYILMFQMSHSNGHSIVDLLGWEFLLSVFIAENIWLTLQLYSLSPKNGRSNTYLRSQNIHVYTRYYSTTISVKNLLLYMLQLLGQHEFFSFEKNSCIVPKQHWWRQESKTGKNKIATLEQVIFRIFASCYFSLPACTPHTINP